MALSIIVQAEMALHQGRMVYPASFPAQQQTAIPSGLIIEARYGLLEAV